MASPIKIVPALPRVPQSTEDRLAEMDAKIGRVIAQLNELIDTTHRLAAHLDGTL